jgi:hypothetical protein
VLPIELEARFSRIRAQHGIPGRFWGVLQVLLEGPYVCRYVYLSYEDRRLLDSVRTQLNYQLCLQSFPDTAGSHLQELYISKVHSLGTDSLSLIGG